MIFRALLLCVGLVLVAPASADAKPNKKRNRVSGAHKSRGISGGKARAKDSMKDRKREQDSLSPAAAEAIRHKLGISGERPAHVRGNKGKALKVAGAVAGAALIAHQARKASQRAEARRRWRKHGHDKRPSAALLAQQKMHARREARLSRVRELATEKKDEAALERVTKLQAKEEARYLKWLEKTAGGAR
jgi:hypothetical protein